MSTCTGDNEWTDIGKNIFVARCPEGYYGFMSRLCEDGQLGSIMSDRCELIPTHCEARGNLPKTEVGKFAQDGIHYTYCGIKGWGDTIPVGKLGSLPFCPADGKWPSTLRAEVYYIDYADTNDNNEVKVYSRICNGGTWEDEKSYYENKSELLDDYCPADGEWPAARNRQTVIKRCPAGYGGMLRVCEEGKYSDVDSSACTITPTGCSEYDAGYTIWSSTPNNTFAKKGDELLYCYNGIWDEDPVKINEILKVCPSNKDDRYNINWSSSYGGIQHVVGQNIIENVDDETTFIDTANIALYTRECKNGEWKDPYKRIVSSRLYDKQFCPNTDGWSKTYIGTPSIKVNSSDIAIRKCHLDGTWGSSSILDLYCFTTGDWIKTKVNKTAKLACPDGYSGNKTRLCKAYGIWEDVDSSSCELVDNKDNKDESTEESTSIAWWVWVLLIVVIIGIIFAIIIIFKGNNAENIDDNNDS